MVGCIISLPLFIHPPTHPPTHLSLNQQFLAFPGIAVFVGAGTVVESECFWVGTYRRLDFLPTNPPTYLTIYLTLYH